MTKKIVSIIIGVIMLISFAAPASASLYYTLYGFIDDIYYEFDSVYLLNSFLSQESIYGEIDTSDKDLFKWFCTADDIPILKKFENNTDDIEYVEISTAYISTAIKTNGKRYILYKYSDKYAKDSTLDDNCPFDSNWDVFFARWSRPEYIEMWDCRTVGYNNLTVYYQHYGRDNGYTPTSIYYYEKDGRYYEITISESDGFSEEDLALCGDFTELPLSIKPGWHEIEGYKCYRDKNGKAVTKPTVIDGVLYAFTKNGVCKGTYTGWAKSAGNKVYYKDGLKVTKNTTVNDVRWKFDKNGICQGKYSGFVTSSKGRRYYNNGVMLRNQKFTLNGKKYASDSKGWVTEI